MLTTGRLDTLVEGPQKLNLQIRQENEDLAQGRGAVAIMTDHHVEHIKKHATVLDGLEARQDPQLLKAVNAHIEEHLNYLRTSNAMLLTIMDQPVMQPPPPPVGGPTGVGAEMTPPQGMPETPIAGVSPPNLPQSPLQQ